MFQDSDEVQKDGPRILDERYKHTLYHVMHNEDDKPCPFINGESPQVRSYVIYIHAMLCYVSYSYITVRV